MRVYLAGRIPIGGEKLAHPDWRTDYMERIQKVTPDALFLDPTFRDVSEADTKAVFGHDLYLIKKCDIVVVNAETPVGLGTAQEMVLAKYLGKTVVSVSPVGSFYSPLVTEINGKRVTGWRHPFLLAFSDWILNDISELGAIPISQLTMGSRANWDEFLEEAIRYYLENYFSSDEKTQSIMNAWQEY